ncbi:MAG: hypothetical protein K2H76_05915, partial [Muribaculaceae bacterium]|nr:hypothetical protein [Muribaculaceae bacterium]
MKDGDRFNAGLRRGDSSIDLAFNGEGLLAGPSSHFNIEGNIERLYPDILRLHPRYSGYMLQGNVIADVTGNNIDNIYGEINLDNLAFSHPEKKSFSLDRISISAWNDLNSDGNGKNERGFDVDMGFLTCSLSGRFKVGDLLSGIRRIIGENVTTLVAMPKLPSKEESYANLKAKIYADRKLPGFLNLPVKPLTDIDISGGVNLEEGKIECSIQAPYLLQGSNKLISNTRLYAVAEKDRGASATVATTFPIKNDRMHLEASLSAFHNVGHIDLGWTMENTHSAIGSIGMDCTVSKNINSGKPDFAVNINPSSFSLGPSEWKIDEAELFYSDKRISIDGLRIWHDNQFVEIDGTASSDPDDKLRVALADIDLEYIFGILNINYVSFGGIATGEIEASSVFTKNPIAKTRKLTVDNLSYNDAVLGNAD